MPCRIATRPPASTFTRHSSGIRRFRSRRPCRRSRKFEGRIRSTTATHPWLVMEIEGKVVGYAYASRHRPRAAYRWTAEVTVYIDAHHHRSGIGRRLYVELLGRLRRQGFRLAVAGSRCQMRQVSDCTRPWVSSRSASTSGSAGRPAPGTMSAGGSSTSAGNDGRPAGATAPRDTRSSVAGPTRDTERCVYRARVKLTRNAAPATVAALQ